MTPAQRYLHRLCDYVARCYEISPSDLISSSASGPIEARRVVYYVAKTTLCLGNKAIGEAVGTDRQLVRHHLKTATADMTNRFAFACMVKKVTAHVVVDFANAALMPAEAAE